MSQESTAVMPEGEFQALSTAPTIDDIIAAKDGGWLRASDNVSKALSILRRGEVEQFNFGPLKLDVIREAQKEGIDFIKYGCFSIPYPMCLYRASIQYDNKAIGYAILMVDNDPKWAAANGCLPGIASVGMIQSPYELLAMNAINTTRTMDTAAGPAVEVQIPRCELNYWGDCLGIINDTMNHNSDQMMEGVLVGMGLTMILNTKGVLKERAAPPAKPQAKRIAAGKVPLPYVTRVYTSVYNDAVAPGPPGTHASPRPHKRRAHVRHYPATFGREAFALPIAAVLVNWDGKPLEARETYRVK